MLARTGGVADGTASQLDRLFGQVDHALRINFLHRPDVSGIGRTEKLMGSTFTPAIKAPLVVTHEIFAGEDRVFLDPDDRLRKIEVARLEHRRIVAAVGIAAPNVERAAWRQHM